jgi:hypothetical protein
VLWARRMELARQNRTTSHRVIQLAVDDSMGDLRAAGGRFLRQKAGLRRRQTLL